MVSGFKENDVYSVKTLKRKLEEPYKEHVVFVIHSGHTDVVCLRKMASFILRDLWQKELDSDDDLTESERVVKAAAKLTRAEICEFDYSCVNYPLLK